jgi:hypothetical protein
VLLTDVDEYISSGKLDWGKNDLEIDDDDDDDAAANSTLRDDDKYKTIRDILENQSGTEPCLPFTRHLYGSKEDYNTTIWRDMAPIGFFETDFVTLRYRWRARRDRVKVNKWQKTIIDVSRISMNDIPRKAMSVHTPLPGWCPEDPKKHRMYRPTLLHAVSACVVFDS